MCWRTLLQKNSTKNYPRIDVLKSRNLSTDRFPDSIFKSEPKITCFLANHNSSCMQKSHLRPGLKTPFRFALKTAISYFCLSPNVEQIQNREIKSISPSNDCMHWIEFHVLRRKTRCCRLQMTVWINYSLRGRAERPQTGDVQQHRWRRCGQWTRVHVQPGLLRGPATNLLWTYVCEHYNTPAVKMLWLVHGLGDMVIKPEDYFPAHHCAACIPGLEPVSAATCAFDGGDANVPGNYTCNSGYYDSGAPTYCTRTSLCDRIFTLSAMKCK
jgi:hypothetical protein